MDGHSAVPTSAQPLPLPVTPPLPPSSSAFLTPFLRLIRSLQNCKLQPNNSDIYKKEENVAPRNHDNPELPLGERAVSTVDSVEITQT